MQFQQRIDVVYIMEIVQVMIAVLNIIGVVLQKNTVVMKKDVKKNMVNVNTNLDAVKILDHVKLVTAVLNTAIAVMEVITVVLDVKQHMVHVGKNTKK